MAECSLDPTGEPDGSGYKPPPAYMALKLGWHLADLGLGV